MASLFTFLCRAWTGPAGGGREGREGGEKRIGPAKGGEKEGGREGGQKGERRKRWILLELGQKASRFLLSLALAKASATTKKVGVFPSLPPSLLPIFSSSLPQIRLTPAHSSQPSLPPSLPPYLPTFQESTTLSLTPLQLAAVIMCWAVLLRCLPPVSLPTHNPPSLPPSLLSLQESTTLPLTPLQLAAVIECWAALLRHYLLSEEEEEEEEEEEGRKEGREERGEEGLEEALRVLAQARTGGREGGREGGKERSMY